MCYGVDGNRNGEGIIPNEDYARNLLEEKRVSDRLLWISLETEGEF